MMRGLLICAISIILIAIASVLFHVFSVDRDETLRGEIERHHPDAEEVASADVLVEDDDWDDDVRIEPEWPEDGWAEPDAAGPLPCEPDVQAEPEVTPTPEPAPPCVPAQVEVPPAPTPPPTATPPKPAKAKVKRRPAPKAPVVVAPATTRPRVIFNNHVNVNVGGERVEGTTDDDETSPAPPATSPEGGAIINTISVRVGG